MDNLELTKALTEMAHDMRILVTLFKQQLEMSDAKILNLPDAARAIGISEHKLREFAENGTVRVMISNKDAKRKHYRFNPTQVKFDLLAKGYLTQSSEGLRRSDNRGRKSTLKCNV